MVAVETVSHQLAVREMLAELMAHFSAWNIQRDALDRVELVMAEALNNVFEHACGYEDGIYLATTARLDYPSLSIEVVDHGKPMPGGVLPAQALAAASGPDVDVPIQALPEGGWGWMLIRDLTDDIRYERRSRSNHLYLRMSLA